MAGHKNKIVSFWSPRDPNAYLGQWFECPMEATVAIFDAMPAEVRMLPLFRERREVLDRVCQPQHRFNTAEMFMMAVKASLMGDEETMMLILAEKDPKKQKALGRAIRPFDEAVWVRYNVDVISIGNYLKFSQNADICEQLLATGASTLVEGSPVDRIYGVGLRFDDPRINDRRNWRGKNLLGEALMFTRNVLRANTSDGSSSSSSSSSSDNNNNQ